VCESAELVNWRAREWRTMGSESRGERIRQDHAERIAEHRKETAQDYLEAANRATVSGNYPAAVAATLKLFAMLGAGKSVLGTPAGFLLAAVKESEAVEYDEEEGSTFNSFDREMHRVLGGGPGGLDIAHEWRRAPAKVAEYLVSERPEAVVRMARKEIGAGEYQRDRLLPTLSFLKRAAVARGYIEPMSQETFTVGEDFEESWLHELYEKRRSEGRSLAAVIVARDNATGTGKTTLALQLAKKWSREEWSAEERATNRSWEYREMVRNAPAGSVLLADEIGQMFDSRRSMSESNVQASQDWQMLRFRELITLATLPGTSFLDKRLRQLADVLILATRRGHARVYLLKSDDATGEPFREHKCNVEWGALDDDPEYQKVEEMKADRFEERFGDAEEEAVSEEELEAARREGRNETIRKLATDGFTQVDIAEALELDQSTVSRIAREE